MLLFAQPDEFVNKVIILVLTLYRMKLLFPVSSLNCEFVKVSRVNYPAEYSDDEYYSKDAYHSYLR